jgi:hypothetical protein
MRSRHCLKINPWIVYDQPEYLDIPPFWRPFAVFEPLRTSIFQQIAYKRTLLPQSVKLAAKLELRAIARGRGVRVRLQPVRSNAHTLGLRPRSSQRRMRNY